MSNLLHVSSNPHVRDDATTTTVMLDVIIALIPATFFGIYNFGIRALLVILITIASCVATEAVYEIVMKKQLTIKDLSAVVTGLLLALNLPPQIPFWIAIIGGIFAIFVVKMIFGGLGQNFMNPALAARCFLLLSFTGQMTNFTLDGISTATPLYNIKHGETYDVLNMFVGKEAGTIGETSVIALLIGAIYLLTKRIINYRIPVYYIATFTIFAGIYAAANGFGIRFVLGQLCGGGLMLGAFFMATDYVTSPITHKGKVVYGILLGIITGLFRLIASSTAAPEGVSYAIIFCNLLVPIIDNYTMPIAFGWKGVKDEENS
jgi:RnfABCDGE-type electron transport complex D subunit